MAVDRVIVCRVDQPAKKASTCWAAERLPTGEWLTELLHTSIVMPPAAASKEEWEQLAPSRFVSKNAERLVAAAMGRPIVDVACGGARNAVLLSYQGAEVIGVDISFDRLSRERQRLDETVFGTALKRLKLVQLDLLATPLPFEAASLGGIINVHFLHWPLLQQFSEMLAPGALLLLETVDGHGRNYLDLPSPGLLRSALSGAFDFEVYVEKCVGPTPDFAVSAKILARKK